MEIKFCMYMYLDSIKKFESPRNSLIQWTGKLVSVNISAPTAKLWLEIFFRFLSSLRKCWCFDSYDFINHNDCHLGSGLCFYGNDEFYYKFLSLRRTGYILFAV